MKRILLFLTVASVLGGCTSSPRFATGVSTPEARAWSALVSRAFAEGSNLHGVLLEYQGARVVEATADGWDSSLSTGRLVPSWSVHGPDTAHDIRSVTKSVVALLAGTVLARHPEASLSLRIRDFPDLAARASPDALDVTLEDWLGMTSGLAWKEWGHPWWDSDETALVWTNDPWRHVLSRPATAPRGQHFVYSGGSTQVAAAILERIDGRPLDAIAADDLWRPLGIEAPSWGRRADGQVLAFAGLGLSLRDLAKLGGLVLDGGRYHGQIVVPPEWVAQITAPRVRTDTSWFDLDPGTDYGLGWWTGTLTVGGRMVRWCAAIGNGGQRVWVVPELRLTVVLTAGQYGDPSIQRWETDFIARLAAVLGAVKEP